MDGTPYFEALQALLPKIKSDVVLKVYLSESEKQTMDEINQRAAPVLKQCQDHFPSGSQMI